MKTKDKTLRALALVKAGVAPHDAWLTMLEEFYAPENLKDQQSHGCPKWAFCILCHMGHVEGVVSGCCPKSERMRSSDYTLKALKQLFANPFLSTNKAELKRRVFGVKGQLGYRAPEGEVEVLFCLQGID